MLDVLHMLLLHQQRPEQDQRRWQHSRFTHQPLPRSSPYQHALLPRQQAAVVVVMKMVVAVAVAVAVAGGRHRLRSYDGGYKQCVASQLNSLLPHS